MQKYIFLAYIQKKIKAIILCSHCQIYKRGIATRWVSFLCVGIGYFAISVLSYHLARRKNDVVSKTQRWQTWFRQRAVQWGERLPLVPICRKGFRRGPVFRGDLEIPQQTAPLVPIVNWPLVPIESDPHVLMMESIIECSLSSFYPSPVLWTDRGILSLVVEYSYACYLERLQVR